jgi:hypothetical protein
MSIVEYEGGVDALHTRLKDDYAAINEVPMNQWESSFYLEAIQDAIDADSCWIHNDSIIVVDDGVLVYASWKGTARDDFLLLLYVFNKYKDIRILPLGIDHMGLTFLMNGYSLAQYHGAAQSDIRTDFARYDVLDIAVYVRG